MKVLLLRPSQYCKEHNTAVTNRYKLKVKAIYFAVSHALTLEVTVNHKS